MDMTKEIILDILEKTLFIDTTGIDEKTKLFEQHILTSLNVINLILCLNQYSGVELDESMITIDDFETIEAILNLINEM